jgi:hypothetical protein
MPTVGFEPTISVGEWTQTYALDRAATVIGVLWPLANIIQQTQRHYKTLF